MIFIISLHSQVEFCHGTRAQTMEIRHQGSFYHLHFGDFISIEVSAYDMEQTLQRGGGTWKRERFLLRSFHHHKLIIFERWICLMHTLLEVYIHRCCIIVVRSWPLTYHCSFVHRLQQPSIVHLIRSLELLRRLHNIIVVLYVMYSLNASIIGRVMLSIKVCQVVVQVHHPPLYYQLIPFFTRITSSFHQHQFCCSVACEIDGGFTLYNNQPSATDNNNIQEL